MKRRTKKQKHEMMMFISKNLHLTNSLLADKYNMTNSGIEKIMQRNNIKRTSEQILKIGINSGKKGSDVIHKKYRFDGKSNPNWKGGISKNSYHYKKIQVKRYPEKISARKKVHYAIKKGKLKRDICEIEGCNEIKTFAHHEDYSKPLDVNWLCRKHHRAEHDNKH